jgi:hypothetical protein
LLVAGGRLNVSIALNRPTWQASTYGTQTSSYAVDGSKMGTCAGTTGGMTNPWWAVDLGEPSFIRGISFTNVPMAESPNGMSNRTTFCCAQFSQTQMVLTNCLRYSNVPWRQAHLIGFSIKQERATYKPLIANASSGKIRANDCAKSIGREIIG